MTEIIQCESVRIGEELDKQDRRDAGPFTDKRIRSREQIEADALAADIAIGGKLRVSVPLEFLWAINERMQEIRQNIAIREFGQAAIESGKVEAAINALVAEASREKDV